MRPLLSGLLLVLLASVAQARSGQGPDGGSLTGGAGGACVGGRITPRYDLGGSGTSRVAANSATIPALSYQCAMTRMPCTATGYTRLGFNVTTGSAGTVSEVGIFDVTGATRITSTGAQSSAVAGVVTAVVPAFTLTGGTQYLLCAASSVAALVGLGTINVADALNVAIVASTLTSGVAATEIPPYNQECTAGSTPFTCCTGLGTGTCLGMVDRTGVPGIVAAAGTTGPMVVMAP